MSIRIVAPHLLFARMTVATRLSGRIMPEAIERLHLFASRAESVARVVCGVSSMVVGVFRSDHQFKVFEPVVRPNSVDVVDDLAFGKASADMLLHDVPVLKNRPAVNGNLFVSSRCQCVRTADHQGRISRSRPAAIVHFAPSALHSTDTETAINGALSLGLDRRSAVRTAVIPPALVMHQTESAGTSFDPFTAFHGTLAEHARRIA